MPRPVLDPETEPETQHERRPGVKTSKPTDADFDVPATSPNPLLASLGVVKPIELAAPRRQAPVFKGAVVIYLGTAKNHSVSLRGALAVTKVQALDHTGKVVDIVDKSVPEAGGEGITSYDFSTHDTVGRLITTRLVPRNDPYLGQYQGKPVALVEHPDHLFHFYRAQEGNAQAYAVVCPPEQQQELISYFLEKAKRSRAHVAEIEAVVTAATASAA